jgi:hypothetical protein
MPRLVLPEDHLEDDQRHEQDKIINQHGSNP